MSELVVCGKTAPHTHRNWLPETFLEGLSDEVTFEHRDRAMTEQDRAMTTSERKASQTVQLVNIKRVLDVLLEITYSIVGSVGKPCPQALKSLPCLFLAVEL